MISPADLGMLSPAELQDPSTVANVAALLGAAAVLCLALALGAQLRRRTMHDRLAAFTQARSRDSHSSARRGRPGKLVLGWLGALVLAMLPDRLVGALARQTARAGLPDGATKVLVGARIVAVCGGGVLALAFASSGDQGSVALLGAALVAVLSTCGIDLALVSRASTRCRAATRDMSTLLDLLTLTMSAGLGFEPALSTIVQHFEGPLGQELSRYLVEVGELGVARTEAFARVAQRLGNPPDLVSFLDAVNRAHSLGTGLLTAVSSQATLLRQERRRRIAAAAQRAPVKMVIPMTLFMLPVLMMVVMAPVGLRLMQSTH
jgi:tight adherence protein C